MKKIVKISLILLLIPLLATIYFKTTIQTNDDAPADSSAWTDSIPAAYLNLLHLKKGCCRTFDGTLSFIKTTISKYRNPISCFNVGAKYYFQLYKMADSFNYPLTKIINEGFVNAHTYIYTRYSLDNRTDMEFLYKYTKPKRPEKIYLDLYGDSTKVLEKNDTLAYYFSKCKNFAIKFNLQDKDDIYSECKGGNYSEIPLEIMFFEKKGALYMAVLSAKYAGVDFKQGRLRDLVFQSTQ